MQVAQSNYFQRSTVVDMGFVFVVPCEGRGTGGGVLDVPFIYMIIYIFFFSLSDTMLRRLLQVTCWFHSFLTKINVETV